jgi:glycosyltransferase involved in cell wall biosynthesis
MPIFNGESFVDDAIASVLRQTMDDVELLLCDDGSTDGSPGIAEAWVSRHPEKVRYLEHSGHVNRGLSATRNLGLRSARGEFIAFIDADDVWRPSKLADQLHILLAHPELGMVCGAVRYWRSWAGGEDRVVLTGHAHNRVVRPPETSLALYPLGSAAAPCPSDLLLRRDAVEAIGGFEERFVAERQLYEDQAFLAKLYLVRPVYFSDTIWLDYRRHADSIVAWVTREGLYHEVRRDFLIWFEDYLRRHPERSSPDVEAALSRALRPYRRPLSHALLSSPGRLWRKGTASLRWLNRVARRRPEGRDGRRSLSPSGE